MYRKLLDDEFRYIFFNFFRNSREVRNDTSSTITLQKILPPSEDECETTSISYKSNLNFLNRKNGHLLGLSKSGISATVHC
jgi:hypothetical protein